MKFIYSVFNFNKFIGSIPSFAGRKNDIKARDYGVCILPWIIYLYLSFMTNKDHLPHLPNTIYWTSISSKASIALMTAITLVFFIKKDLL